MPGLVAMFQSRVSCLFRSCSLVSTLGLFSFQVLPPNEVDPLTKNVTQVGLFGVVMVLLWWIKNEHARQREADKKDLDEEKARNVMLVAIIEKNIMAMADVRSISVGNKEAAERQREATERLIRVHEQTVMHFNELLQREKERSR